MRKILDAIFLSLDDCPLAFREVLGHLQGDVAARYVAHRRLQRLRLAQRDESER